MDRIAVVLGTRGAQRSLFVSRRFNSIYVVNQKCACSAMKLALYRAELDDSSYLPQGTVHNRKVNPLLRPKDFPPDVLEAMLAGGAYRFTFVRNPYSRLVSAYRDKVERIAVGMLAEAGGGQDAVSRFFRRAFGIETQAEVDRFTFNAFVDFVCAQEPGKMNPHWRPQSINACLDVITYDFVGRLERFDSDIKRLYADLGMPFRGLSRMNVTNAGRHVGDYYTPALADRVYRTYSEDFEAFGYPRDVPAP